MLIDTNYYSTLIDSNEPPECWLCSFWLETDISLGSLMLVQYGQSLGGTLIDVVGVDFYPSDLTKCEFNKTVSVAATWINSALVRCYSPPQMSMNGIVSLEITNEWQRTEDEVWTVFEWEWCLLFLNKINALLLAFIKQKRKFCTIDSSLSKT